jgi:AraC family transcriptional activator of pobA
LIHKGLPTVAYLGEQMHLSPKYLSNLLRSVTGLSAQQHIHQQVIERAKLQLSKPELSIAEVAYSLGFGHPQSFSKFFKRETDLSPLAFRQAFN